MGIIFVHSKGALAEIHGEEGLLSNVALISLISEKEVEFLCQIMVGLGICDCLVFANIFNVAVSFSFSSWVSIVEIMPVHMLTSCSKLISRINIALAITKNIIIVNHTHSYQCMSKWSNRRKCSDQAKVIKFYLLNDYNLSWWVYRW